MNLGEGVMMQSAIYSIMSSEELTDFSYCLYTCLGVPVRILNEDGECVCGQGSTTSYCLCFKKILSLYSNAEDSCSILHAQAAKQSMQLKKPFLFSCHADLLHLIFPLIKEGQPCGSILIGPFLMKEADIEMIAGVSRRYALSAEDALILFRQTDSIRILSAKEAEQIGKLLAYIFPGLQTGSIADLWNDFEDIHYTELMQGAGAGRGQKTGGEVQRSYLEEEEAILIQKIREYDVKAADKMLEDLLEHIFLEIHYDKKRVLACAMELCTLLIHAANAMEPHSEIAFTITAVFIPKLQSIKNPENMKQQLREVVAYFEKNIFDNTMEKDDIFKKRATQYIKDNYQMPLTLEMAAGQMMLNPSYFSTLFKQTTGSSFKDYLNYIRIEESKKLLTNTNGTILDIALTVGFENQSYFTKVFRKYTGITPKQYRN